MAAGGGLKDFIFRAEVLKLYRQFVRVARQAPGQAAGAALKDGRTPGWVQ